MHHQPIDFLQRLSIIYFNNLGENYNVLKRLALWRYLIWLAACRVAISVMSTICIIIIHALEKDFQRPLVAKSMTYGPK